MSLCKKCVWNVIDLEDIDKSNFCKCEHDLEKEECKDFRSLDIKDG